MLTILNRRNLKKFYVDLRYGSGVATPLVSYSSFILIAYHFTNLNIIPFPIFSVFFTMGIVIGFIVIGKIFREKQLSVDQDLIYQQQRDAARTQRIILEALYSTMESSNKKLDVYERIQYLKMIESNKKPG